MGILQQNTGLVSASGSFTASLNSASSSANTVVLVIGGSSTINTPASWTLRASQVANMGHYVFERAGVSLTSVAVTSPETTAPTTWWMAEIQAGVYNTSTATNNLAAGTTFATTAITPAAGTKILIASIGSQAAGGPARTISGWTNSFVEQADLCQASSDYPMQGIAILPDFTASGSTSYTTTGTYSASSVSRSAIAVSYATSSSVAAVPPILIMQPRRA